MTAPPKFPGTGLEEVNVPGQNYLRDALTSCTDPLKAIETFQVGFCTFIFLFTTHTYSAQISARKWNSAAIPSTHAAVTRFTRRPTIGLSYVRAGRTA